MVYLVATVANNAELMPALLFSLRGQVAVPDILSEQEMWGVGYFLDDRGLIVRKPASSLDERNSYSIASELRSRMMILCAHQAYSRTEVPPYRFRHWLFGYVGDLDALGRLQTKIMPKLPDFSHDVLGDDHGGRLAHAMFLAELHRAGVLEDVLAEPVLLGQALEKTATTLLRLAPEAGVPELRASFVASNGRMMAISRVGYPLWIREVDGLERLPEGPVDENLHDFQEVAAALQRFRAYAIAMDVLPDMSAWRPMSSRGTTVVDAALQMVELPVQG
ncbi:MAG: hypothetical protein KTR25_14595 [Myxococcales bacterium]|nr:hypothetical protein [Myxococcales bacterium]